MMSNRSIEFGSYQLDVDRRQLLRRGKPVHITPKGLHLLHILITARPNAVSKADITDQLWPSTFVVDSNLSSLVKEIRRALQDEAHAPRFIRTVHGYGYAFSWEEDASNARLEKRWVAARLSWSTGEAALFEGRNIIGRAADSTACIDDRSVSRHHAAITIAANEITLEDLHSKNGTYDGSLRLDAPAPLKDGMTFVIGSVEVTLHLTSDLSTRTVAR